MLKTITTSWKTIFVALALLACTTSQTGCSRAAPTFYATGSDYIALEKGQTFTAPRKMVLATESVIQSKDEQILDLQEVNTKLLHELELTR